MLDFVFITHLPSFYKVNLYNELAKKHQIHVIFLGAGSDIRNTDFISKQFNFECTFLSISNFEQRKTLFSCLTLMKVLRSLHYKKLCLGGWEQPEFWLAAFISAKGKNCLSLESGMESQTKGVKAAIKKVFLSRLSTVLASGEVQKQLALDLRFPHTVLKTKGVGILNAPNEIQERKRNGRFLYVGRFAKEKNLKLLEQAFRQRPNLQISLVGHGDYPIEPSDNIHVIGHVNQPQLHEIYQNHDVLVLPSLSEPWGLVVEEAMVFGLKVIVSDKVGAKELVESSEQGVVFNADSLKDLLNALDRMVDSSQEVQSLESAQQIFIKRTQHQLNSYARALQ